MARSEGAEAWRRMLPDGEANLEMAMKSEKSDSELSWGDHRVGSESEGDFSILIRRAVTDLGLRGESTRVSVEMSSGSPGSFLVRQLLPEIFCRLRELAGLDHSYVADLCEGPLQPAPGWATAAAPSSSSRSSRKLLDGLPIRSPKVNDVWESASGRLIVTVLRSRDAERLQSLAPQYLQHLEFHRNSLISRVVGLYVIYGKNRAGVHIAVSKSMLPAKDPSTDLGARSRKVDYVYKVQGFVEGRFVTRTGVAAQVLQDANFVDEQQVIVVPSHVRSRLGFVLQADTSFLEKERAVGYSLLIGIKKCIATDESGCNLRTRAISASDEEVHDLPVKLTDGCPGLRPNGEQVLFYLGIVDILKCWRRWQQIPRTLLRRCLRMSNSASLPPPPAAYKFRFLEFLEGRVLAVEALTGSGNSLTPEQEDGKGGSNQMSTSSSLRPLAQQGARMRLEISDIYWPGPRGSGIDGEPLRDESSSTLVAPHCLQQVSRGCDGLALAAAAEEFDVKGHVSTEELARWCATVDVLEAGPDALKPWVTLGLVQSSLHQELGATFEHLAKQPLPPASVEDIEDDEPLFLCRAPAGRPSGIAHLKIKKLLRTVSKSSSKKKKSNNLGNMVMGGTSIADSSCQYSVALAIAVGVQAATQCSAKIAHRFAQQLSLHPALRRRKAAVKAKRLFFLPEEGSWLSPPHELPNLQFAEYAPEIFAQIRAHSGIIDEDYIWSVCQRDFSFIEFTTNSKSGEFFFFSHDGRCMIKTISQRETDTMIRLLRNGYPEHVVRAEGSLLARVFGLYHVHLPWFNRDEPKHFLVQENIFYAAGPDRLLECFDLKGSTEGRTAKIGEMQQKDNDWLVKNYKLCCSSDSRERLRNQHKGDCEFLAACQCIDYSLLVGLSESDLSQMTSMDSKPDPKGPPSIRYTNTFPASGTPDTTRKAPPHRQTAYATYPMSISDLSNSSAQPKNRRVSMVLSSSYRNGDMRNGDKLRRDASLECPRGPHESLDGRQFYLGIIDFQTSWTCRKRFEHCLKCMLGKGRTVSVNPPTFYARRQIQFMESHW